MPPPDEPRPSPTRRRVRVFVIACIVVVLVVGFWPVMGYRIPHGDAFVRALEPSGRMRFASSGFLFQIGSQFPIDSSDDRRAAHDTPAFVTLYAYRTFNGAVEFPESMLGTLWLDTGALRLERSGARAYLGTSQSGVTCVYFQFRNVAGDIWLNHESPNFPADKTKEEFALECLDSIVAGLRNQDGGVSRVYLPPFVTAWRDHRLRQFDRRASSLDLKTTF